MGPLLVRDEWLTCIETKHSYALYAPLSTRPEMKKQVMRMMSVHLVDTSAFRWVFAVCHFDVMVCKLLVSVFRRLGP